MILCQSKMTTILLEIGVKVNIAPLNLGILSSIIDWYILQKSFGGLYGIIFNY
jgi:hypothetical protein